MIKYLVMDVDGTITDGKVYMGSNGEVMKAFSIKDGYAINYILKPAQIRPVILTARESKIVLNRCDELGIQDVYQGKLDKLTTLLEIVGEKGLSTCAYFGDDILDLKCMMPIKEAGGIVACPADAVLEVREIADYVCASKAGDGALREFSEWLVKPRYDENKLKKKVAEAIEYLKNVKVTEVNSDTKIKVNEEFFYTVQRYFTRAENTCPLESHRRYVDIQIMLKGKEYIDFSDISRLRIKESYNWEKDVTFWNIPERMGRTMLSKGDIIVLYPENAHRGGISIWEDKEVLKIVGKVRVL